MSSFCDIINYLKYSWVSNRTTEEGSMDIRCLQTSVTQQSLKVWLVILQVMMMILTLFVVLCKQSCQPRTYSMALVATFLLEGRCYYHVNLNIVLADLLQGTRQFWFTWEKSLFLLNGRKQCCFFHFYLLQTRWQCYSECSARLYPADDSMSTLIPLNMCDSPLKNQLWSSLQSWWCLL